MAGTCSRVSLAGLCLLVVLARGDHALTRERLFHDLHPHPLKKKGAAAMGLGTDSVLAGATEWPLPTDHAHQSELFVSRGIVKETEASGVIDTLRGQPFQTDLDSVDNAATFQFWLYAHNRRLSPSNLRTAVAAILDPVLEQRVLPLVNELYPGEDLKPCFSFIRRYESSERMRHPTHFDVQSHTTFVTSLNRFGIDYEGGLYVATGDRESDRLFIELDTGDGAVHQSDLLHGVQVLAGERWSWVVWFRPESCDSDATEWHRGKADNGDPVHQFLLARRLQVKHEDLGEPAAAIEENRRWMRRAAENGFARAQNELGESLRVDENKTPEEDEEAKEWLTKAAASEPSAKHNLALWHIERGEETQAVKLFEDACEEGSVDACFNMAIAHSAGKAGIATDTSRAVSLLRRVDSPESLLYAYQIGEDMRDLDRAAVLGSVDAQFLKGRHLSRDADYDGAAEWWMRAANNGHEESQRALIALRVKRQRQQAAKQQKAAAEEAAKARKQSDASKTGSDEL